MTSGSLYEPQVLEDAQERAESERVEAFESWRSERQRQLELRKSAETQAARGKSLPGARAKAPPPPLPTQPDSAHASSVRSMRRNLPGQLQMRALAEMPSGVVAAETRSGSPGVSARQVEDSGSTASMAEAPSAVPGGGGGASPGGHTPRTTTPRAAQRGDPTPEWAVRVPAGDRAAVHGADVI